MCRKKSITKTIDGDQQRKEILLFGQSRKLSRKVLFCQVFPFLPSSYWFSSFILSLAWYTHTHTLIHLHTLPRFLLFLITIEWTSFLFFFSYLNWQKKTFKDFAFSIITWFTWKGGKILHYLEVIVFPSKVLGRSIFTLEFIPLSSAPPWATFIFYSFAIVLKPRFSSLLELIIICTQKKYKCKKNGTGSRENSQENKNSDFFIFSFSSNVFQRSSF